MYTNIKMKSYKFLKLFLLWSLGLSLFVFIALTIEKQIWLNSQGIDFIENVSIGRFYNPIFSPTIIIWFILMIFATFKLTRLIKNETGKEPRWFIKATIFFSLWLLMQPFWGVVLKPILKPLLSILTSFF